MGMWVGWPPCAPWPGLLCLGMPLRLCPSAPPTRNPLLRSRRYVWDIIQEAKAGRAIVLTTHRCGVMALCLACAFACLILGLACHA